MIKRIHVRDLREANRPKQEVDRFRSTFGEDMPVSITNFAEGHRRGISWAWLPADRLSPAAKEWFYAAYGSAAASRDKALNRVYEEYAEAAAVADDMLLEAVDAVMDQYYKDVARLLRDACEVLKKPKRGDNK